MGVKTDVTAKSARTTADLAERLINCILRNIRGCSEMGQVSCIFSESELSEVAITTITKTLENLGFKVNVITVGDCEKLDINSFVDHTTTYFVIKW